jgi:hypothetical protein
MGSGYSTITSFENVYTSNHAVQYVKHVASSNDTCDDLASKLVAEMIQHGISEACFKRIETLAKRGMDSLNEHAYATSMLYMCMICAEAETRPNSLLYDGTTLPSISNKQHSWTTRTLSKFVPSAYGVIPPYVSFILSVVKRRIKSIVPGFSFFA